MSFLNNRNFQLGILITLACLVVLLISLNHKSMGFEISILAVIAVILLTTYLVMHILSGNDSSATTAAGENFNTNSRSRQRRSGPRSRGQGRPSRAREGFANKRRSRERFDPLGDDERNLIAQREKDRAAKQSRSANVAGAIAEVAPKYQLVRASDRRYLNAEHRDRTVFNEGDFDSDFVLNNDFLTEEGQKLEDKAATDTTPAESKVRVEVIPHLHYNESGKLDRAGKLHRDYSTVAARDPEIIRRTEMSQSRRNKMLQDHHESGDSVRSGVLKPDLGVSVDTSSDQGPQGGMPKHNGQESPSCGGAGKEKGCLFELTTRDTCINRNTYDIRGACAVKDRGSLPMPQPPKCPCDTTGVGDDSKSKWNANMCKTLDRPCNDGETCDSLWADAYDQIIKNAGRTNSDSCIFRSQVKEGTDMFQPHNDLLPNVPTMKSDGRLSQDALNLVEAGPERPGTYTGQVVGRNAALNSRNRPVAYGSATTRSSPN